VFHGGLSEDASSSQPILFFPPLPPYTLMGHLGLGHFNTAHPLLYRPKVALRRPWRVCGRRLTFPPASGSRCLDMPLDSPVFGSQVFPINFVVGFVASLWSLSGFPPPDMVVFAEPGAPPTFPPRERAPPKVLHDPPNPPSPVCPPALPPPSARQNRFERGGCSHALLPFPLFPRYGPSPTVAPFFPFCSSFSELFRFLAFLLCGAFFPASPLRCGDTVSCFHGRHLPCSSSLGFQGRPTRTSFCSTSRIREPTFSRPSSGFVSLVGFLRAWWFGPPLLAGGVLKLDLFLE